MIIGKTLPLHGSIPGSLPGGSTRFFLLSTPVYNKYVRKCGFISRLIQEILHGDCLELMRNIPDASIDVLITDPPYHNVKSHSWDNEQKTEGLFLSWFDSFLEAVQRKMAPTCSGYIFCKPSLAPTLSLLIDKRFDFQSEIVWCKTYPNKGSEGWKNKCKKSSLRRPYPSSERIIFFSRDEYPIQIRTAREKLGLGVKELTEKLGAYGKVNNGGQVSNWENGRCFPSPKYLLKLEEILSIKLKHRKFDALAFNNFEDVLFYQIVPQRSGKHPCEKPMDLMEDLVKSITNSGDIVFDPFAGSGTTLVAAKNLNRSFIGFEKEKEYYDICLERLGL